MDSIKTSWQPGKAAHWVYYPFPVRFFFGRIFGLVHCVAIILYLQFRIGQTINNPEYNHSTSEVIYQVLFLIAEAFCAFGIIFCLLERWKPMYRDCINFKEIPNELLRTRHHDKVTDFQAVPSCNNYPSVCVLIPCYNEDVTIVSQTVIYALDMDYPAHLLDVYLCDDGKDPLKKEFIRSLRFQYSNVGYITRKDGKNAKGGNLNNAIKRTSSDLLMILDADFIPHKSFLQRTLSYYYNFNPETGFYEFDSLLGFVQTPQNFRNLSPEDNDMLDQRATAFTDMILPGKDYFGAACMIGTNVLLNRKVVLKSGCFPSGTITEDTAMTMVMHATGHKTYYSHEELANGLACTTLHSQLTQRARWAKGDYQIAFSLHNPLLKKGLTFPQRFLYFSMAYNRAMALPTLFFTIGLPIFLIGSIFPMDITSSNVRQFFWYFTFYVVSSWLYLFTVHSGPNGVFKSFAAANLLNQSFVYLSMKHMFTSLFLGEKLKFKVTQKEVIDSDSSAMTDSNKNLMDTSESSSIPPSSTPDGISSVSSSLNSSHLNEKTDGALKSLPNDTALVINVTPVKENEDYTIADVCKNLNRCWFNILMGLLLIFGVCWALFHKLPSMPAKPIPEAFHNYYKYQPMYPLFLSIFAIAYSIVGFIPHAVIFYKCFGSYLAPFELQDVQNGSCAQWVSDSKKTRHCPTSWATFLMVFQTCVISVALVILFYLVYIDSQGDIIRCNPPDKPC